MMFVCKDCIKPEGYWLFMLMLSHGECEICRKIATCADIHDYDLIKDKLKDKDTTQ